MRIRPTRAAESNTWMTAKNCSTASQDTSGYAAASSRIASTSWAAIRSFVT